MRIIDGYIALARGIPCYQLTEEITTSCYGLEVRVVDAAGAELCQRLRDTLPPEFAVGAGAASGVFSYLVTIGTQPVTAEHPGYRVSRDGPGQRPGGTGRHAGPYQTHAIGRGLIVRDGSGAQARVRRSVWRSK